MGHPAWRIVRQVALISALCIPLMGSCAGDDPEDKVVEYTSGADRIRETQHWEVLHDGEEKEHEYSNYEMYDPVLNAWFPAHKEGDHFFFDDTFEERKKSLNRNSTPELEGGGDGDGGHG